MNTTYTTRTTRWQWICTRRIGCPGCGAVPPVYCGCVDAEMAADFVANAGTVGLIMAMPWDIIEAFVYAAVLLVVGNLLGGWLAGMLQIMAAILIVLGTVAIYQGVGDD